MEREQELSIIEKHIREVGVTLCEKDKRLSNKGKNNISCNPEGVRVLRTLTNKQMLDEKNSLLWMESGRKPRYNNNSHGSIDSSKVHTSDDNIQKWMK